MRIAMITGISMILLSCSTAEKSTGSESLTAGLRFPEGERIVGVVHHSDPACGTLIHIELNEKTYRVQPLNLDQRYNLQGTKIKFFFKEVKGELPPGCEADAIGELSDVTPLR